MGNGECGINKYSTKFAIPHSKFRIRPSPFRIPHSSFRIRPSPFRISKPNVLKPDFRIFPNISSEHIDTFLRIQIDNRDAILFQPIVAPFKIY